MSNRFGVMVRRWAGALLMTGMGFAGSAIGAILLVDGTGELTGATGVDVGGTLYDVVFRDGPCSPNFTGCDDAADFTFQSSADAQAASSSLLSQVFLGEFDSNPERTFGCSNFLFCETRTPYDTFVFIGEQIAVVWVARNQFTPPFGGDLNSIFPTAVSVQVEFDPQNVVWADWSLSQQPPVGAVPEPATLALLALGLAGFGFSRRRH